MFFIDLNLLLWHVDFILWKCRIHWIVLILISESKVHFVEHDGLWVDFEVNFHYLLRVNLLPKDDVNEVFLYWFLCFK